MALSYGHGIYGDGVGVVTPLDDRLWQIGMWTKTATKNLIRAGLLYNGSSTIVTGTAGMSYDVAPFAAVSTRGATQGVVPFANDATANVATTAAPGSNSRIDSVYAWPRDFAIDGVDSDPVLGVAQGTPAASPTPPSLAAFPGAIELARITVPAGVTATNSGTTITQVAPFTAAAGGVVPFRSTAERDAGSYNEGQLGWLLDTDTYQVYSGSAWQTIVTSQPGLVPIVPTSTGTVAAGGKVTFSAVSSVSITCFTSTYDNYLVKVSGLTQSTSATIQMRLRSGSTDESSTVYDRSSSTNGAGSLASGTLLAQTSWELGSVGAQAEWDLKLEITSPALAAKTRVRSEADALITGTNAQWFNIEKLTHRTAAAYDGFTIYPSSGTITGTIRVYGYNNNA